MIRFDDETLYRLFGAEDAENEEPARLKQYFFRNKAYESLIANLPIRVLVGHKGVGKSALLKMAYLEDAEADNFALWVRPDDVKEILTQKESNFNAMIDAWKKGLVDVIFRKSVERIGRSEDDDSYAPTRYTLNALIESVRQYLTNQTNKVVDAAAQAMVAQFLKTQTLRIYIDDLDRGWKADLRTTFEQYSNERLQDIVNEFKTEFPNIAKLVHGMKPTRKERTTIESYLYTNDQLMVKLRTLIGNNDFRFTNGTAATAKTLAEFLYKIDFITARKDNEGAEIVRIYFDQNRYLQSQVADYGFKWEIHPAYRWALQPGEPGNIFRLLDLSTT